MKNVNVVVLKQAHEIIQKSDYKNKDHLYFFLSKIRHFDKKFKDRKTDYVYIPARWLLDVIPRTNDIKQAKDFLVNNGIIDCDNHWNMNPKYGMNKPLGYKYNDNMYGLFEIDVISVELTHIKLNKKIIQNVNNFKVFSNNKNIDKIYNQRLHNKNKLYQLEKHFIDNFRLDEEKAFKWILDEYNKEVSIIESKYKRPNNNDISSLGDIEDMFNDIFGGKDLLNNDLNINVDSNEDPNQNNLSLSSSSISNQNDENSLFINTSRGFLFSEEDKEEIKKYQKRKANRQELVMKINRQRYFSISSTNGRAHTDLTSLNSELRQFIISPTPLINLDIKNSQPYFLSLYLKELNDKSIPKQELDKFIDLTERGQLYNYYKEHNSDDKEERKKIKEEVFTILFGTPNNKTNKLKKELPNIIKLIDKEKKENHSLFAIKLQQIESETCIHLICPELIKNGIIPYTIHDSYLIEENKEYEALKIINDVFQYRYGSKPPIKIEKVN